MSKKLKIEVEEGYKRCLTISRDGYTESGCKEIKPFSEFNKNKKANDGYKNICRECDNRRVRDYCKEFKDGKRKRIIVKTKTCHDCDITFDKPYEFFEPNLNRKDGLQSYCKKCRSKRRSYGHARERAKEKGIPFDVTYKQWNDVYKDD